MTKISIYMPTKNRLQLLQRAIESVLRQDYENFELVITDDGSNDDTPRFLQHLSAQDPRIVVLRNDESCGPQIARNMAILASTGEFLTGLDDDDEFTNDRLSTLLTGWEFFAKRESNISGVFSQDIWMVGGKEVGVSKKKGSVGFDDFPHSNQIGNQIFSPRNHFVEAGLFNKIMPAWQDMELFVRMTRTFGNAKLVDLPLYRYDATPNESRISKSEEKVREACRLICEIHYPGRKPDHRRFMMQLFAAHYGFKPRWSDFEKINTGRLSLSGSLELISFYIKNIRS